MKLIEEVIQQGIRDKWHYGAQLYVENANGQIVDKAFGTIDGSEPLKNSHILSWMSSSKMITAAAIAKLYDSKLLRFEDKVSNIIPEFSFGGKQDITIKHLLTHTCGFRVLTGLWEKLTRDEILEKIYRLPLEPRWEIGKDAGYHVHTSFMILGEIIYRVSSQLPELFIKEQLFSPLQMDYCFLGEVPANFSSLFAKLYKNDKDENHLNLVPDKYLNSSCPCKPGGSGRGPINELAKFMRMIKNEGALQNKQIINSSTIQLMLSRHRKGIMDKSFQKIIDWGLGFMCNSNMYNQELHPYSFGELASKNTFGHCGIQTSTGYIDFDTDLIICFNFNGMPGELNHYKRLNNMNEAIYKSFGKG